MLQIVASWTVTTNNLLIEKLTADLSIKVGKVVQSLLKSMAGFLCFSQFEVTGIFLLTTFGPMMMFWSHKTLIF